MTRDQFENAEKIVAGIKNRQDQLRRLNSICSFKLIPSNQDDEVFDWPVSALNGELELSFKNFLNTYKELLESLINEAEIKLSNL